MFSKQNINFKKPIFLAFSNYKPQKWKRYKCLVMYNLLTNSTHLTTISRKTTRVSNYISDNEIFLVETQNSIYITKKYSFSKVTTHYNFLLLTTYPAIGKVVNGFLIHEVTENFIPFETQKIVEITTISFSVIRIVDEENFIYYCTFC